MNKNREQRKTQQEKKKQWQVKYHDYLPLEQIESLIEKYVSKEGDKKGSLSKHLEGALIDEQNKGLYLYFVHQKDKRWLKTYSFIIQDTIEGWDSGRRDFELCEHDHPSFKALKFGDRKVKDERCSQKGKRRREISSGEEKIYSSTKNSKIPDEDNFFEENEESAEIEGIEEFEEDQRSEEVSDGEILGKITSTKFDSINSEQSKLKKKKTKKDHFKQRVALRADDQYVDFFYEEIGNGKKLLDLIWEYIQKKDGHILQILHKNKKVFLSWENIVSQVREITKREEEEEKVRKQYEIQTMRKQFEKKKETVPESVDLGRILSLATLKNQEEPQQPYQQTNDRLKSSQFLNEQMIPTYRESQPTSSQYSFISYFNQMIPQYLKEDSNYNARSEDRLYHTDVVALGDAMENFVKKSEEGINSSQE